ncbi:PLP-dependent transferase [Laetiporus sulphureus 93-53]|uniref:PLP-dependent transferase n=1 Tax=Laetiporus sulphureus 93-53 TaxID=1314785 RepID=A0A165ATP0_9APHY|nr:PLP-dependent transferase [Laetiporus sulphureus 93-53]KZS99643.1 PLP-dependent transferase [Laetiporus sulphureus 93-53]
MPPSFKFCPEFNFPDGKFIVVSQGWGFRVNREVIFDGDYGRGLVNAMVLLTEDGSATGSSDGKQRSSQVPDDCVLIELDIEADDTRRFFRTVYHGSLLWAPKPKDFATVASIVRFAHYLKVQGLLTAALERICRRFPNTLERWKKNNSPGARVLTMEPGDAVTAIKLAHMTGTMTILPTALYWCCMLDTSKLLRFSWDDVLTKKSYGSYIGVISSAQVRLAFKVKNVHTDALKGISSTCETVSLCTCELDRLRSKYVQEASLVCLNIIDTLTQIYEDINVRKPSYSGFCDICAPHIQHNIIALQDPYYFLQYSTSDSSEPTLVPSFLSLDVDGRVMRVDSFSKIIAPSMRLGWITSSPFFHRHLVILTDSSTQHPHAFGQMFVTELLGPHGWTLEGFGRWVSSLRAEYQRRRDYFLELFEREVVRAAPGLATPGRPQAGMFVISVERHPRYRVSGTSKRSVPRTNCKELMEELFESCLDGGLVVMPAWVFALPYDPQLNHVEDPIEDRMNYFRLTFAGTEEAMQQGLSILGRTLKEFFADEPVKA